MAILFTLPGITVTVLSTTPDSTIPVPLTEYSDDQDPIDVPIHIRHKSTTNYIQCIPGAPFSFKLKVAPPYKHDCPILGFEFRLNGVQDGDFQLCHREDLEPEEGGDTVWEDEVKGLELLEVGKDGVERMVFRRFKFAELKTNDDHLSHRTAAEKEAVKKLGLVEVWIYRQRQTKFIKPKRKNLSKPVKEVPEKLAKGLAMSLSVELGNAEEAEETIFQATSLIDGEDHPVGVFRFKYRSKRDLQQCFIIPRSLSPERSLSPPRPTFSSLDALEIAELARVAHQKSELCQRSIARLQKNTFVSRPFEDLDDEERRELAKEEWEGIVSMAKVKHENGAGAHKKRKRGKGRREERRREDGRLEISLIDDDEPVQQIAEPQSGNGEGEVANDVLVLEDVSAEGIFPRSLQEHGVAEEDEVVFVSTRPVKKSRAEREAVVERKRVKEENS